MTDHKTHRAKTKLVLGREYAKVHRWIDAPYGMKIPTIREFNLCGVKIPYLDFVKLGRRHRILRHDLGSIIGYATSQKEDQLGVLLAAIQHLKDDGVIRG